jgi:hypothetical protein|tara:strand:- start:254 stop:568 length:315 start_codon:yes stop_codon:yes gene_type:complete
MKVLSLDECKDVIKKINSGVPAKVIAKRFNVDPYDITLINRCRVCKYPLDEYKLIDDTNYKFRPINDSCKIGDTSGSNAGSQGWDLRMSMKLSRLPISAWAAAL